METTEYIIVNNCKKLNLQRVPTRVLNKIQYSTTSLPGD